MPIEEFWLGDAINSRLFSMKDRALAVDVGANRGSWTSELSKLFTKVVAIEPDERAYSCIAMCDNVEIVHAAASSSTGESVLYLRKDPDQNSLLESHPIGVCDGVDAPAVSTATIRCVTLDELCPNGADFVKIDVEGAEASVLRGCSGDGRWDRTVFVVECHDTKAAVAEELSRLGKTPEWVPHPLHGAHPGHCWGVA